MKPLPQEIIDHIFSFIPYCDDSDAKFANKTLVACTKVSHLFWVAARRRIFSRLILAQPRTFEKTQSKLKNLSQLLEQHGELLNSISIVEIDLNHGPNQRWAFECDALLHRILSLIIGRPQKLDHLKMSCWQGPIFQNTFDQRTQEDILYLLTGLQTLSLMYIEIPVIFLEALPPLKHISLFGVQLASGTDVVHALPSAFHPGAEIEADYGSLKEVHHLYRSAQQPLPCCMILRLKDIMSGESIHDIMDGSQNTMTRLELEIDFGLSPTDGPIDFGHFKKLTDLSVSLNCHNYSWTISTIIDSIKLHFGGVVGLFHPFSSPSHLVNLEISLLCRVPIYLTDADIDEANLMGLTLKEELSWLKSHNLLVRHPNLKTVKLNVALPFIRSSTDNISIHVQRKTVNNYKNFVEGCIREALAEVEQPVVYVVHTEYKKPARAQ
ncbi:hypothetical protein CPB83DRAFT_864721 [Crepidotus variabilis]|uniref:F-box domain-containing protein n=1 Tax=Crepidotus variabilis TaxID=179855 RepID=A0A9P6E494_9AGAR|nr:hypothetical protein CPB83DRAFT_864721 [Crepidotus variabilis]